MNFLPISDRGCNGLCSFLDKDSEELYTKNLKIKPKNWKYRHKNITYRLNSSHYRTVEFDTIPWEKCVVIFGCSTVFGIGASIDETIAAQFSKITGIPAINMGVPGSSPQFALYNSAILKNKYPKPKAVVFGWTSAHRCSLFLNPPHTRKEFYVQNCGIWGDDPSDLGKAWNKFDSNPNIHLQMTRLTAKEMWRDVNYTDYTMFVQNRSYIPDCKYIKQTDEGRDCSHPGYETNYKISRYLADSLNL